MKVLIQNKKINLNYEVLDSYTAGIALLGHEVKSLKSKQGSLAGAYVTVSENEAKYRVVLRGLAIPPYQPVNNQVTEQDRPRLLLLEKKEIRAIERELHNKGVTIVPQAIGEEGGKIKVTIALVRGKKKYDKREDIKRRDQQRDAQRETKARFS